MKLIISGGTGYVATELIRQGLASPRISSLVVLSRKPVQVPQDGDAAGKLKQVIIDDYVHYSDATRREFQGADACIWTVAITPSKSKKYDFDVVRRVCQESPLAGIKAMMDAGPAKSFRFVYMSGSAVERDPDKKPAVPYWMLDYTKMRGETETKLLAFSATHQQHSPSAIEMCIAKPGLITSTQSWTRMLAGAVLHYTNALPNVTVQEAAAAMLRQVVSGVEKETLTNADLKEMGQRELGGGE